MNTAIFLFTFIFGSDHYHIFRISDDKYRFEGRGGSTYVVPSWKEEIRHLTRGKVNYR